MKVVFPKHIEKGLLSGMSFNIGPINLSIIQLFIVAIGVAAGLGIFNAVSKAGSKAVATIAALPVLIIFLVIAFFKVSELGIVAFMAKIVKNNFLDVRKKYQVNSPKLSYFQILAKKNKLNVQTKKFEQKDRTNNQKMFEKIDEGGLI